MGLLPIDLTEFIGQELEQERRENDGLLHASSHLIGPLRHAQLEAVAAPKKPRDLLSEIRMKTGTMWHSWLADQLRSQGIPAMMEVNLTPWMPVGWGGTADLVIWNPQIKAFVLADLKTTKGESMRYIERDGAKEEHQHQVSLYWHALKKMGLPLAKQVAVFYLPLNQTRAGDVEPVLIDFAPLPAAKVHGIARERHKRVERYRTSLPKPNPRPLLPEEYVTDELEPGPEREQRLYYDRNTETWDLKLVAPWYAAYCEFGELCSCHEIAGTTKIGTYDVDGKTYYPRKGYESVEPLVAP